MGLFNGNPEVIEAGLGALRINAWFYFLYLIAEVPLGCARGMKKSLVPGILNVVGICLPRVLWVWFVFPLNRSLTFLFICYPISWICSGLLQWGYYIYCRKKLFVNEPAPAEKQ